jgi:hypothetical protein
LFHDDRIQIAFLLTVVLGKGTGRKVFPTLFAQILGDKAAISMSVEGAFSDEGSELQFGFGQRLLMDSIKASEGPMILMGSQDHFYPVGKGKGGSSGYSRNQRSMPPRAWWVRRA